MGKKLLLDVQPRGVGWTSLCPDTTVQTVKEMIQEIEGIPPDAQRLVALEWGARKAVVMEDHHTLQYYDIQECDPEVGRTLGLALSVFCPSPIEQDLQRVASEMEASRAENDADASDACAAEHAYIIINVQDLSGRTHVVHAFPSTTIATIRAVLVGKSGNHEFGKAGCRLIFAGATLEPGRALSDYNIVSGYSSGMTYQIYEVLSYGDAAPPACPESCGDRERPSGLPPCNYWCVNTIYMDTSDAEVMAMNGIEV